MPRPDYGDIHFLEPEPQHRQWICQHTESGLVLGYVAYKPTWAQYCYYPKRDSVYWTGSLQSIAAFVEELNKESK